MSSISGIHPVSKLVTGLFHKFYFKTLFFLGACLAFCAINAQAYPVNFMVTGTFGSIISGTDPLALSGTPFSMTGSIDSTAPTPYTIPSLSLTVGSGATKITVTLTNVPLTLTPGTPGTIVISASVIGQPFTATVKVSPGFPSSTPAAFGSESMTTGSQVAYGSGTGATTLSISGTVNAGTTAPVISGSPTTFNFTAVAGGASQGQPLTISSSGAAEPFTLTVNPANTSWLSVSSTSGTTGGSPVNVQVTPGSLSVGLHTGKITLASTGGPVSQPTINVNLTITAAAPTITPSPTSLTFNYQIGGTAPSGQSISLNSSGSSVAYSVVTAGAPSWLSIPSGGSGNTPGPISVGINTSGLTAQTYNYTLVINLTGASTASVSVPITLNVTAPPPTITPSPTSLTFNYQIGGTAPSAQPISLNDGGTHVAYSVVTAGAPSWLSIASGGSGNTPGPVSVGINTSSLTTPGPQNYTLVINLTGASSPSVSVPITVNVSSLPSVTPNPASLTFNYQIGGSAPAAQPINLNDGGTHVAYSVVTAGAPSWLSISGGSGNTPGPINVGINTTGLSKGTQNYTITINLTGASTPSVSVPVTLNVTEKPSITP
ncbi:MAG TPA: hypothetical protein VLY24_17630, partial [Bryobacteraceae bacterium]|nr:hypothetical protein [Bryobacteraceae bacterium]